MMQMRVQGSKLIIEVDVSEKAIKDAAMSKSGKSRLIASTNGFNVADEKRGIKVSLNVITKA